MATTTTSIFYPIDYNVPHASLDALYGPWNSVEEALNNIPGPTTIGSITTEGQRHVGLTAGVITTDGVVEYWFKNGISDSDFIVKTSGSEGSDITVDTSVTASSTNPVTSAAIYSFVENYMDNIADLLSEI